jgi:replication factor A1
MGVEVTVRCLSSNQRQQMTQNGERTLTTGLVADETMIRRFVSWEGHNLEKNGCYNIKGASVRTFRGELELNLGAFTVIEVAPEGTLSGLDVSKLPRYGQLLEVALKDIRSGQGNVLVKGKVLSAEKRQIETEKGTKRIVDGMLADDTKRVRFTSWHDFGFEVGDVISVKGAYVKDWRGIPQLNFDERAEVERLPEVDFDVMRTPRLLAEELQQSGASDVEVAGTVIEIRDGSGLIFRCPSCNRALSSGSCTVHGPQDGMVDLRTKIVLDDGTGAVFAVLNTELTEQVLGMSVKECEERFCNEESSLVDQLVQRLLGRDLVLRGNVMKDEFGPNMLPAKLEDDPNDTLAEAKRLLDEMGVT